VKIGIKEKEIAGLGLGIRRKKIKRKKIKRKVDKKHQ